MTLFGCVQSGCVSVQVFTAGPKRRVDDFVRVLRVAVLWPGPGLRKWNCLLKQPMVAPRERAVPLVLAAFCWRRAAGATTLVADRPRTLEIEAWNQFLGPSRVNANISFDGVGVYEGTSLDTCQASSIKTAIEAGNLQSLSALVFPSLHTAQCPAAERYLNMQDATGLLIDESACDPVGCFW